MKKYEAVLIFDALLEQSAIEERFNKHLALVTGDGAGVITKIDQWGKRPLQYPIMRREFGYYVIAQFDTTQDKLPEFERLLKLDESLLRYLVVANDHDLKTEFIEVAAPDNGRDDEEDE